MSRLLSSPGGHPNESVKPLMPLSGEGLHVAFVDFPVQELLDRARDLRARDPAEHTPRVVFPVGNAQREVLTEAAARTDRQAGGRRCEAGTTAGSAFAVVAERRTEVSDRLLVGADGQRHRTTLGGDAGVFPGANSGNSERDQGISKSGNRRARKLAIELAWLWLRHQPGSELSRWFCDRVRDIKGRLRRITIVALARKLMVALWRYLETGMVPTGAVLHPSL